MKEFNEERRRKIAYNCRKATYLIEKQQLTKLTLKERLELELHLAGCSICRIFGRQSLAINQMAKQIFSSRLSGFKLDEDFKRDLQKQIDSHVGRP